MSLLNLEKLDSFFDNLTENIYPELINDLETEKDQATIDRWINNTLLTFKTRCEQVNDEDEFQRMLIWFYVQVKSDWHQLNMQVQYAPINGHEMDMGLIYLASIIGLTIREIEVYIDLLEVEQVTHFLSMEHGRKGPVSYTIDKEAQEALEEITETLQFKQTEAVAEIDRQLNHIRISETADREALIGALINLQSKYRQISQSSSELRKHINELRKSSGLELFNQLDRFWSRITEGYVSSLKFSVIGGSVSLDSILSKRLVDPLAHCMRCFFNETKNLDTTLDLKLKIRYSGSELEVQLHGQFGNKAAAKGMLKVPDSDSAFYQTAKKQIGAIGASSTMRAASATGAEFVVRIPNLSSVMVECLVFEAADMMIGITRDAVGQIIKLDPDAVSFSNQAPIYRHRDYLYPYVSIGSEIQTKVSPGNILILSHDGREIALGVEHITGFEMVALHPVDKVMTCMSSIRNVGLTSLGSLINYLEVEQLFENHQISADADRVASDMVARP